MEATGPPVDGGSVVITGASSGIGRELAVQLADRASTLVLVARRAGRLEELRASLLAAHPQLHVVAVAADLSDPAEVEGAVTQVDELAGPVDILVNNAGVGSGAGLTVMPAAAAYSASKHFIDGFSEALRADLAGTGVVVTQVCPGPVDSEFDQTAGSAGGMTGGPPQFLRISAAECAREALAGFDRGAALVFPGRGYRLAMRALPLLPRRLARAQAARAAARLRRQTHNTQRRDG